MRANMMGRGSAVEDCTKTAVHHHGAQYVSPIRSERRRGGRTRYLMEFPGLSGWVRKRKLGMNWRRMGL